MTPKFYTKEVSPSIKIKNTKKPSKIYIGIKIKINSKIVSIYIYLFLNIKFNLDLLKTTLLKLIKLIYTTTWEFLIQI